MEGFAQVDVKYELARKAWIKNDKDLGQGREPFREMHLLFCNFNRSSVRIPLEPFN